MDNILKDLNKQQKEAVTFSGESLLVLAGAGSGKTKVLTHRAAYIVSQKEANPENLLLLTFTNKAANEMKERINKLLSTNYNLLSTVPFAGTFHSFCARLLRIDGERIGIPRSFLIYDDNDQKDLIKQILQKLDLPKEYYNPGSISAQISEAKTMMLSPLEYAEVTRGKNQEKIFLIYNEYEKELKKAGALDFDDLLLRGVEILKEDKFTLEKWQSKLTQIFVDEWQDTNKVQYKLTKLLVGGRKNLTAVGDASQCLPPGTLIHTSTGMQRIEKIKCGDRVVSATGRGKTEIFSVNKIFKRKHNGKIIILKTSNGKVLRLTPNHIVFARLIPKENLYHIYLMYRRDMGYRIGQAKGMRSGYPTRNKKSLVGIASRGNQESADKMWVIKSCKEKSDANYWECYYSFKYGIPTLVFDTAGRSMLFTQENINKLFSEIDTEKRVLKRMHDLNLDPRFPHHRPKGISGYKNYDRQIVHLKFSEENFK